MKTTFKRIKLFNPCGQKIGSNKGWQKLIRYYKPKSLDEEISIEEIIKSNGIEDAIWALRCIKNKEQLNKIYLFCADVAESVLYIFEQKCPNDKRPRKAINAIRLFVKGEINIVELKTAVANAANAAVANAAGGAGDAATYAAAYAADIGNTINTATNTATAAITADAAYTVACVDTYTTTRATYIDGKTNKQIEITKLLKKYL